MNDRTVVVDEVDATRLAMRLVAQKLKAWFGEKPLEGIYLQLQQRALKAVAATVDGHIPLCLEQVVGLVELHAVRAYHRIAAAHDGRTLHGGLDVGSTRDAVGLDERGQGTVVLREHLLLQQRARLEHQRRTFGQHTGRLGCLRRRHRLLRPSRESQCQT